MNNNKFNLGMHITKIIDKQGRNKNWVADKVNINEKTFYDKLAYDRLTGHDLLKVAKILNIDLNKLKEYEGGKKMNNDRVATVIFDNGGGVTLQLGEKFAHHYDDGEQAAGDYKAYLEGDDMEDWEGHEEESLEFKPSYDDIQNGGYVVYDIEDIDKLVNSNPDYYWGCNVGEFLKAL